MLFKYAAGSIFIQDVNHYGPRPEWASEAYHVLNHLMVRGIDFLPISLYEDDINAAGHQKSMTPHRAFRSSSIYLNIPDSEDDDNLAADSFLNLFEKDRSKIKQENISKFPINALDLNLVSDPTQLNINDSDGYFKPMFMGSFDNIDVNHASLMAILSGKATPDGQFLDMLVEAFEGVDAFHRVMILYALANHGRQKDALALYGQHADGCETSGLDVKFVLAKVFMACAQPDACKLWLEKCCEQSTDTSLTGAPMQYYQAALIASKMGLHTVSGKLIDAAYHSVHVHETAGIEPTSMMRMARLLFRMSFRRPRMFLAALGSGFPKRAMFGGFIDFFRLDLVPRLLR